MGYKSKAGHRPDAYKTNCNCKHNYFKDYQDAKIHLGGCASADKIYYNPGYDDPVKVYPRD